LLVLCAKACGETRAVPIANVAIPSTNLVLLKVIEPPHEVVILQNIGFNTTKPTYGGHISSKTNSLQVLSIFFFYQLVFNYQ
jgi:hypothetical protein